MEKFSRTLTLRSSVFLGLSSMIGAGLFLNIAPTAKVASYSLVLGLLMASAVAFSNASSSAQLARIYPQTGGTYLYAKNVLGKIPSLIAGYSFIVGKSISCIAIGLTLGNYISPAYPKYSAVVAVLLVTMISFFGLTKTVSVAKWFVYSLVGIIFFYIISITASENFSIQIPITSGLTLDGFLLSSSIWFFAFTGYSRLATFGEEIKNPEEIIPKAILIGLGLTVLIYVGVAWVTLGIIDPQIIENSLTPLKVAFDVSRFSDFSFLITIGSTIATGSVLLALVPGISRILVAMSRDSYLPSVFKTIHKKFNSAYVSEIFTAGIIIIGILFIDVINAVKLSSFFILIYYSLTNLSVIKLEKNERLYSSLYAYFGLISCVSLSFGLLIYF